MLLAGAELFLGCFAVFGFPAFLAKAALLFQVNRPERVGSCAFELLGTEGEFRFYAIRFGK